MDSNDKPDIHISIHDFLNKIYDKQENLIEGVHDINITLARQEENLKEHTRRSLANERAVEILKEELKPVLTHVEIMKFLGKITLFLAGSTTVWKILKLFNVF